MNQMDQADDGYPLLTTQDATPIAALLKRIGVLAAGESVTDVKIAGEGNMNVVLRICTDRRAVIVKQSLPWVAKYPDIAAPVERIEAESRFYQIVRDSDEVAAAVPRLLGCEPAQHVIVLEDFGESADYSDLYTSGNRAAFPLQQSVGWLAALHGLDVSPIDDTRVGCRGLLELNHAHIFEIPFRSPSAIPLDNVCEGLEMAASDLRGRSELVQAAKMLGEYYLGYRPVPQPCLLHGDYYPGSWLRNDDGMRVIDPEFCFIGPGEFDLGVLVAHQALAGGVPDEAAMDEGVEEYRGRCQAPLDDRLLKGFAGIEIIRRLIGVAQLPLTMDLKQRQALLEFGSRLLGGCSQA